MTVLLINTPRSPHNSILEHASDQAKQFIHKKLIGPPLGLLTLAGAISSDHDVIVWDTKGEYDLDKNAPPLKEMVKNLMTKYKPDVVGTTVITSEFYFGIEILQASKEVDKKVLTVIGGVYATLCIEDFTDPSIDVICKGQAAHLFKNIIDAKEKNKALETVAGIYLNTKKGIIKTKGKVEKHNAARENFIFPDRKLLERWRQTYIVGNAPSPSTYLFSSLGCPYSCSFCSIWCEYEKNYFQREVESIIQELKSIDYEIVRFADANTIVNVDFISKLFDRIEQEEIQKTYIMDIRSDTAVKYPWLIEKLARNGLKVVICGFESFREDELEKYNKISSVKNTTKAIEIFHNNDIMLRGNYVIPHDYEIKDFKAMAEFTGSYKVTYAGYTILTPMPGTPYHKEMKHLINDFDLSKYNFFNCVLPTKIPLKQFYKETADLWLIKKGKDVI